jgi:GTPase SAR1 family protein
MDGKDSAASTSVFGQVVVGPPGSGKSTYCNGMRQFLRGIGRAHTYVVNLDPANDHCPYTADVDVCELITVQDVMETHGLGPNGALMYCMEYLLENAGWLKTRLDALGVSVAAAAAAAAAEGVEVAAMERAEVVYVLIDMPGQVELYTHHQAIKALLGMMSGKRSGWRMNLCCVNLVDAHYITDSYKYISILLLCLSTMVQLEMPHVNVLSKMDMVEQYGSLDFNLDFYTDVQDLSVLTDDMHWKHSRHPRMQRYRKLTAAIAELVEDYSIVRFHALAIEDKALMIKVSQAIDTCNGYVFAEMDLRTLAEQKEMGEKMMAKARQNTPAQPNAHGPHMPTLQSHPVQAVPPVSQTTAQTQEKYVRPRGSEPDLVGDVVWKEDPASTP